MPLFCITHRTMFARYTRAIDPPPPMHSPASLRGELDILRYRLDEISELEDALCKVRALVR